MANPGDQRKHDAQAGAEERSSERTQPIGAVPPTNDEEHATALLDARQHILDAIDQFACQIPFGEDYAQQTKEAVATALDYMEAQALQREAELQHDLGGAL